jgi:LysM repeat protein
MKSRIYRVLLVCALLALLTGLVPPVWGAPQPAPEQQGTSSVIHVVQWGEYLSLIAGRYGVTVPAIVQANGLTDPDYIYAGQRLVIPSGVAPPPPPPGQTTTYIVQRGDTLSVIARRYGTTVNDIVALNGLMNPNLIYVGQQLQIPGQGTTAPPTDTCVYVVKAGDTLTAIALSYRTTVWAIAIANNLANPSFIWVGQRLVIPGCSEGAPPAPAPTSPAPAPTPTPTTPGAAPTATPTTAPAAPTATPTPTNTPPQAYQYRHVSGPTKDPCHPGFCVPEVSGIVLDAQGNPLGDANAVWIKIQSGKQGTAYCRTGDRSQYLQPGTFKFVSQDGDVFGEYSLTVLRSQADPTPLSPTYQFRMNSMATAGQQSNIVFQANY